MSQRGSLRKEPIAGGAHWVLRFKLAGAYKAVRIGTSSEFRTRSAARAQADRIMAAEGFAGAAGKRITLADYIGSWKSGHMVGIVRPSTQAQWKSILAKYLLPAFATLELTAIDVQAMQQLIGQLGVAGKSRARIQSIMQLMRQILRQASKDGFAAASVPPYTLKYPKELIRRAERRCFTASESSRIIQAERFPFKALYAILAYTGCRIGEGLGMAWENVNFSSRQLHVRQAAVQGKIYLPKTARSVAWLPMPAPLAQILNDYRDWLQSRHPNKALEGLLFESTHGGPCHASGVRQWHFAPLLKVLNIPHAGLHAFRHGMATLLFEQGVEPGTVQRILRHGTLRTTMSYAHSTQERAETGSARVANLISAAT